LQVAHVSIGDPNPLAKGNVDEIEERMNKLVAECAEPLLNTISDSLFLGQKEFLSAERQNAIDRFAGAKALPRMAGYFFVHAIKRLLKGFEAARLDGAEHIDSIAAPGAFGTDAFRQKIGAIITDIAKDKDKSKLRTIIHGGEK
jgi:hypothetical protein